MPAALKGLRAGQALCEVCGWLQSVLSRCGHGLGFASDVAALAFIHHAGVSMTPCRVLALRMLGGAALMLFGASLGASAAIAQAGNQETERRSWCEAKRAWDSRRASFQRLLIELDDVARVVSEAKRRAISADFTLVEETDFAEVWRGSLSKIESATRALNQGTADTNALESLGKPKVFIDSVSSMKRWIILGKSDVDDIGESVGFVRGLVRGDFILGREKYAIEKKLGWLRNHRGEIEAASMGINEMVSRVGCNDAAEADRKLDSIVVEQLSRHENSRLQKNGDWGGGGRRGSGRGNLCGEKAPDNSDIYEAYRIVATSQGFDVPRFEETSPTIDQLVKSAGSIDRVISNVKSSFSSHVCPSEELCKLDRESFRRTTEWLNCHKNSGVIRTN